MPFDCGLRTGALHGSMPMSRRRRSVSGGEAETVIGEPFDALGQRVDAAEAVLHGGDHKVLHVLGV